MPVTQKGPGTLDGFKWGPQLKVSEGSLCEEVLHLEDVVGETSVSCDTVGGWLNE